MSKKAKPAPKKEAAELKSPLWYIHGLVIGHFTLPKEGDKEGELTVNKWVSKKVSVPICVTALKDQQDAKRVTLAAHLLIKVTTPDQLKKTTRKVTITLKEVHVTARRSVDQQAIDQNPEIIAEGVARKKEKEKASKEGSGEKSEAEGAKQPEMTIDQRSIHRSVGEKAWGREPNMKNLLEQMNKDLGAEAEGSQITPQDVEKQLNEALNLGELAAQFSRLPSSMKNHMVDRGFPSDVQIELLGDKSIKWILLKTDS